jgi:hypothetical protein
MLIARCRSPSCVGSAGSAPLPYLYERLTALTAHRRLVKSDDGYRLTAER